MKNIAILATTLWMVLPVSAQTVTTDSGSLPPVIKHPLYFYPDEAQKKGEQGTVIVRSLIDEEGYVRSAEVARSSGSPSLDQAAVISVRYARYSPSLVAGVPTPTHILIPVKYDLTAPSNPNAPRNEPESVRFVMKDTRSIGARIKANISFVVPANWERNDPVEYEVSLSPNGLIQSVKMLKSSGLPEFDKAVRRAIALTEPFPANDDGTLPPKFLLVSSPRER